VAGLGETQSREHSH
jgi:hypothetical protein